MGKKVTELTEATTTEDDDILMIVQDGENKKITKADFLEYEIIGEV